MSLFQKSVLSKYLKGIDEAALATQWQIFKQHFHNPTIQQNIRQSKEEQYQEGFLNDLFVKVLGYTKNPEPNFNLTTELKNISNAKKTDGAIIIDNKTIAVIELKGTNTTDLSKVETQAFQYKNNQPDAVYVITSNFEKLRFYIDNAVDFLEFNLFQLSQANFKLMWLCLAHQNLSKGIAKQVKDESLFNEENITKKLYKDYSTFKNELFASIQTDNPQYDKLTLYKKTQKLLDRFLFIFFAEDRLLLPPNSIRAILKQWEQLKDLDEYKPLYSRYKKYFGYMNTGYRGKQHDIFAYNGGLFAPDDILDNIKIDDEVLAKHTQNLSQYDFESEVSVNILGHIFEHSLNEIEAITAELEGKALDAKKTKRKKDGVFYTPKYITKYIVENTVGKLCIEKKTDLNINEADYAKERKGRKKETLKKLQQQLESYRNWLLSLTICDPACGSGAFLNQALEFLITEHRYIDELQAKLLNEPMVFSDIENAILENNLFGVDINEESVDIAKLSLWLRTAQKGRKLTTLSSNIKCGNSLIDDPAVAGAKAFNWQNEFPQVFENGGFDVVIGNPPYVRNEFIELENKKYFSKEFSTFTGKSDLYVFFFEQSAKITKTKGEIGFIASSKYTKTKYGKKLISYLNTNVKISRFIDFKDLDVFSGIIAYPSIITYNNMFPDEKTVSKLLVINNENYKEVDNGFQNFTTIKQIELFERLGSWKVNQDSNLLFDVVKRLKEVHSNLKKHNLLPQVGIKTGYNKGYIFSENDIDNELKNASLIKKYVLGKNVKRYLNTEINNYILMPYIYKNDKLTLVDIDKYSVENSFLNGAKEKLSNRAIIKQGIEKGTKKWYELQQIKIDFPFSCKYIIYPDISDGVNFSIVENVYYDMTCFGIPSNSLELLGILNSKLSKVILEMICVKARGGYLRLKSQYILELPIPFSFESESLKIAVQANNTLHKKLSEKINRFLQRLYDNIALTKPSKNLEVFYKYDFKTFLSELKKKKIKLSLSQQDEWEDYFNDYKAQLTELQNQINQTDTEIDQMVYQLYGLTDEEIKIVEASV